MGADLVAIGEVPDSRWAYSVAFEDGDGSVRVCVTDLSARAWEVTFPMKIMLETLENEQGMLMSAIYLRELTLRGLAKGVVSVVEETAAPRAIVIHECSVFGARMKLSLPPAHHTFALLGEAAASRIIEKIARGAIQRCAEANACRERAESLEKQLSEALETVSELAEQVRVLKGTPWWKRQTLSGVESYNSVSSYKPAGGSDTRKTPGSANVAPTAVDEAKRKEMSASRKRDLGGGLKLAALLKKTAVHM